MIKEINRESWLFLPAQNQETLNQHAPAITMAWMANTNIQPPATLRAVLSYVGKFVSKPETSCEELTLNAPLPSQPLLINVDGFAESGKTLTLLKICAWIQELIAEAGK